MKNGRLIQDLRTIELTNLVAKHGGAPCIAGDMVDQNVAPSVGDASLVIEGEEFEANVIQCVGAQIIFESGRFEEIARKIS